MKKQVWYFTVLFENGFKNSEWNLTKTAAKALYDYHIKNMLVLGVQRASFGSYDEV